MLLSDEKRVRVRRGDRVQWDKVANSIVILRGGQRLCWKTASGTDDKCYFSMIKSGYAFEVLVEMLAQILCVQVTRAWEYADPTYLFY